MSRAQTPGPAGPPPLRPFGLVLHRDGGFRHEGQPIRNAKLRALFARSLAFLPDEGKYVVRAGHFRGEVEVEEAAFFVRSIDLEAGTITLSDQSEEALVGNSLCWSRFDPDVLMCRVKHALVADGLLARFTHGAQAELLLAADADGDAVSVEVGGDRVRIPAA